MSTEAWNTELLSTSTSASRLLKVKPSWPAALKSQFLRFCLHLGQLGPSYVLRALGIDDELAHSSIRFSLGRFTTEEEIDYTVKLIKEKVHSFVKCPRFGRCTRRRGHETS